MPAFKNWIKNTSDRVNRFIGKTAGHIRTGVTFLNNTILPGATRAHKAITAGSNELQKDANISEKNRERLKSLNKFSDIGLQKLGQTVDTVNRVKAAI